MIWGEQGGRGSGHGQLGDFEELEFLHKRNA